MEPDEEQMTQAELSALFEPSEGGLSYTEIRLELEAAGKPVPPGIAMLAAAKWDTSGDPRIAGLGWRPKLNS